MSGENNRRRQKPRMIRGRKYFTLKQPSLISRTGRNLLLIFPFKRVDIVATTPASSNRFPVRSYDNVSLLASDLGTKQPSRAHSRPSLVSVDTPNVVLARIYSRQCRRTILRYKSNFHVSLNRGRRSVVNDIGSHRISRHRRYCYIPTV